MNIMQSLQRQTLERDVRYEIRLPDSPGNSHTDITGCALISTLQVKKDKNHGWAP